MSETMVKQENYKDKLTSDITSDLKNFKDTIKDLFFVGLRGEELEKFNKLPKKAKEKLKEFIKNENASQLSFYNNPENNEMNLSSENFKDILDIIINKGCQERLKTLAVGKTSIAEIPDNIKDFSNLINLSLVNNKINKIPKDRNNENLKQLSLYGNALGREYQKLFNLTSLQTLNLQNCGIKGMSSGFGNLINLGILILSNQKSDYGKNNEIESLKDTNGSDEWLKKLQNLSNLNLSNVGLKELPEWDMLEEMESLESLEVSDNKELVKPNWGIKYKVELTTTNKKIYY